MTSVRQNPTERKIVDITLQVSVHPSLMHCPRDAAEKARMAAQCAAGWQARSLTLDQLAAHVGAGGALAARFRAGYRRKDNFEAVQFVAVDLDHGPDVAGALAHPFAQAWHCIAGATPSSTPEAPRTRLIFPLAEPITDLAEYADLAGRVLHQLAELEPDPTSAQGERFIFGCQAATVSDGALLTLDALRALPAPAAQETPPIPRQPAPGGEAAGSRPGDEFNARGEVGDVLLKHGWSFVRRVGQKDIYRRPGKDHGVSATFNAPESPGLFYNFSANAAPFEAEKAYAPFAVYTLLEHGGDYQAAARQLAGEGYGTPPARVASAAQRVNGSEPAGEPAGIRWGCNDAANGARLAHYHGADLRYCYAVGAWFVWDGRRWAEDLTGAVMRRARDTANRIAQEAAQEPDNDRRADLFKWAGASLSNARLKSMIEQAQSTPPIPVRREDFDADPYLLNCANGTVNLRTGALRPHDRADLITKLAPVEYDPDARLPLWESFLDQATEGDAEKRDFLQRAVGMSTIGEQREEKMLLLAGDAATGKSTAIDAVKAALGDYGLTADFESFLSQHYSNGPRNDLARLAGARIVVSTETDKGRRLAEGILKQITGGDTLTVRFLRQEHFEYKPTFTLWLVCNDLPHVRDDDAGIWRRLVRIPFTHVIPEAERDPNVKATLRDPVKAGPAVLAWIVRGALAYQRDGRLLIPESIRLATEAYRAEQDPLADFFDEYCILKPEAWTATGDLWRAYQEWGSGQYTVKRREFYERLRRAGCEPEISSDGKRRGWRGVGLVVDVSDVSDTSDTSDTNSHKSLMRNHPSPDVQTGVSSVSSVRKDAGDSYYAHEM